MRGTVNYRMTLHAAKRKQQRGISDAQIRIIETFGRSVDQKGGCEYAYMPAETAAELRAALDKIAGVRLVYGERDALITAMHETRRLRRA